MIPAVANASLSLSANGRSIESPTVREAPTACQRMRSGGVFTTNPNSHVKVWSQAWFMSAYTISKGGNSQRLGEVADAGRSAAMESQSSKADTEICHVCLPKISDLLHACHTEKLAS
jgi:hypothetical protein